MSRLENNKFFIHEEMVDINQTIKEVTNIMEFQTQHKLIALETFISHNVPQRLKTDQKRYKQLLFNLIGNAIKFTFKGGIKVKVDFESPYLITEVIDTGIGIKDEEIGKLFRFFGKVQHSKKINKGGMGFGLTISKMLVEQMDGEIHV